MSRRNGIEQLAVPVSPASTDEKLDRLRRYLEILASAGEVVMAVATAPGPLGWLGGAMRGLNLAYKVRDEVRASRCKEPSAYFSATGPGVTEKRAWTGLGTGCVGKWVVEQATDRRVVTAYWDGTEHGKRPVVARVGDVEVGWLGAGQKHLREAHMGSVAVFEEDHANAPFATQLRLVRTIGERIWARMGTVSIAHRDYAVVPDDRSSDGYVPTAQFLALRDRLVAFLEDGTTGRGVLLNGLPGSGKSLGSRWLAQALGRTSMRVDASDWGKSTQTSSDDQISAHDALQVFRPDVVVIDDADRVENFDGSGVLYFFEQALKTCKLVLVSVNCPDRLIGALLRPGRIDDVVRMEDLEPDVIRTMIGSEHANLAKDLVGLPAAYVADFAKRLRVLGRERAIAELPGLREHAAMVARMTARENGDDESDRTDRGHANAPSANGPVRWEKHDPMLQKARRW